MTVVQAGLNRVALFGHGPGGLVWNGEKSSLKHKASGQGATGVDFRIWAHRLGPLPRATQISRVVWQLDLQQLDLWPPTLC